MEVYSLQQFFAIAGVSVSTQSHSASFQSFRFSLSAVIPIQRRRIEILDRSDFEMCCARFFLSFSPPLLFFPFFFSLRITRIVSKERERDARFGSHENRRYPQTRSRQYCSYSKKRLSATSYCCETQWLTYSTSIALRKHVGFSRDIVFSTKVLQEENGFLYVKISCNLYVYLDNKRIPSHQIDNLLSI